MALANVVAQFVRRVDHFIGSTGLAEVVHHPTSDLVHCFREAAMRAQNKLVHIHVDQLLQDSIGVCAVHNGTVVGVGEGLSPELHPQELLHFGGLSVQTARHIRNVGEDCVDAIARSFNLTKQGRHLVAVLWVVNGGKTRNVDEGSSEGRRHGCWLRFVSS